MGKYLKVFLTILLCEGVGLLATPFTIAAIPTWYASLHKPIFSPPNFVFGPVWTALYLLMGIAFGIIVNKNWQNKKVRITVVVFLIQLFLNFTWSVVFFGLKSPFLGLVNILLLFTMIIVTIFKFQAVSKNAAYLLVPYFIWVSFATLLNFSIVILNP